MAGSSAGAADLRSLFEVIESDLRALSSEARRTDGNLATQITGWLQHTDYGQIKEVAERGALQLRAVAQDGGGLAAVRDAKVRWRHPQQLLLLHHACGCRWHRVCCMSMFCRE